MNSSDPVDRANVQGLVSHNYPCPHARILLFATGGDIAAARAFIASWLPRITRADQDPAQLSDPCVNLSISRSGLQALRAIDDRTADFPDEFTHGPEVDILGDYGESAPDRWWGGKFNSRDVHLVVHLYTRTAQALDAASAELRRDAAAAGMREHHPVQAAPDGALTGQWLSADGRELHFGYRDGFSQPALNWNDEPNRPDLLDFRHFILGHASSAIGSTPRQPPSVDLVRDGTYAVMRWLSQDVPRFERYLTENGPPMFPRLSADEARELLAAKIMGRWRDGTPLVLSSERSDPALASHDFSYANDQAGLRCPLAAHIRIANHRDDRLSFANESMFGPGLPRVIRRGMSYGPKYTGNNDDAIDRGIVGIFLCASINRQYNPLARWMHTTNFRDEFKGEALRRQDPLVGNRSTPGADTSFIIPMPGREIKLQSLPDFVHARGTLFLLMPGLSGLRLLARPLD